VLQASSGPEGSRKLRFPGFIKTAQDGDKFVSLTHRPPLLTYSMLQSPSWEGNWFAASQEIPCTSQNPKVHYRTHKRPPPVISWASSIQSIYPHPTSWRSILILSTHLSLGLPVVSFPPVSLPRPYTPPLLTHTRHMHSPTHSYRPAAFTPRKCSWYSFLLEAESTPGP